MNVQALADPVNEYTYRPEGSTTVMTQVLGAPRCSYGSNVWIHIQESASRVINIGEGRRRYTPATDLVQDRMKGVWFQPCESRKTERFDIDDNGLRSVGSSRISNSPEG